MILRLFSIIIVFFISYFTQKSNADGMVEVFKWKQMDYYNRGNNPLTTDSVGNNASSREIINPGIIYFPGQYRGTRSRRQSNNASYIPYNNVPMGATHYKGRLFVTMPRRRVGIPSTLNYIDLNNDDRQESPKLIAYPDFDTNQLTSNFEHIVSVYRTNVDTCGRLWFIDTGMLEYPNNFMQVQRPTVWIIDLHTDKVIRRFEIPLAIAAEGRGLASITPDTDNGCDKAFAYIPDLVSNRLNVYSYELNKMWSFEHNYFNFDPIAGDFKIGGQSFRWNDGIFSVSLGPKQQDGSRFILFHAMASNNEFVVSSRVLQDERNAQRGYHGTDFRLLGNRGIEKQATMHQYDHRTGVIFYDEIQRNGVGCWNTHKPFTAANHGQVAQDEQTMIYPSDLTIDEGGIMWVMTNSMPIFIYSNLDTNKFNFRVWKQNTETAIQNTVCA